MIKPLAILFLVFMAHSANAQDSLNLKLKHELDSMFELDQQYRLLVVSDEVREKPDSVAKSLGVETGQLLPFLINKMNLIDSSNIKRVEEIIAAYGYPGISIVGKPTNQAAFFIIQHSQRIDNYLPIIKSAAQRKELAFGLYAMMLDRSLMYNGKEQLYGTQGSGLQIKNPATGQKEFTMIIWPIKNPKNVNKRRKKAGFKETVEENAKRLGIIYVPYTISDINKMKAE